jgi:hypothetical protein
VQELSAWRFWEGVMADSPSHPVSGDVRPSRAQPTGPAEGSAEDPSAAPARSSESRIFRIGYSLVRADLWLRTVILVAISAALIVLAFQWHLLSRPTIASYLAAQLGTGLLVAAVGAALVQAFVMSAPQTLQQLVEELQARPRGATVEDRLAELTAELRAYELRTRVDDVLTRTGVEDVLTSPEKVAAKISSVLADPAVTDVRLLGLSLTTLFGGRRNSRGPDWPDQKLERLLLREEPGSGRRPGIRVRVLLVDPDCLSLRLLARGSTEESAYELGRLMREIREVAERLSELSGKVAGRRNGNSLHVRFYRAVPPFFLFAAREGALSRSYFHGMGVVRPGALTPAAVWQYSAESPTYQATCQHFDAIWEKDSVPCGEVLAHMAIGTDQGIGESGVLNIYTSRPSAEARIKSLIENAKERVWIQGVSLSHHLSPPLEEEVLKLLYDRSIDTRILILDPDSDQAVRKSYRDYLLDQDGSAIIDYETYARDRTQHNTSGFYGRLRHSAQQFENMSAKSAAGTFQVRQYACAPTSYILIADDHALIEQFHYGKPVDAGGPVKAQLQLAREMPLIEYGPPGSGLFEPEPWLNPLAVIEDHFVQVFEHFGSPLRPD